MIRATKLILLIVFNEHVICVMSISRKQQVEHIFEFYRNGSFYENLKIDIYKKLTDVHRVSFEQQRKQIQMHSKKIVR